MTIGTGLNFNFLGEKVGMSANTATQTQTFYVSVPTLKENTTDELLAHLNKYKKTSDLKRDSYWLHHETIRRRNNILTIPLLIVSSATGVVSTLQLNEKIRDQINYLVLVLGVSTGVLTALHKYFNYAERAENAKMTAKTWGRITRKIDNSIAFVKSSATQIHSTVFTRIVEDIYKEIDDTAQQAHDVPDALLNNMGEKKGFFGRWNMRRTLPASEVDQESPQ